MAQLVGHLLAKQEVAGSSPVSDSNVPGGLCELTQHGDHQKMARLWSSTLRRTGVRHPGHSLVAVAERRGNGLQSRGRRFKSGQRLAEQLNSNGSMSERPMEVGCKPTAYASQVRILVLPLMGA